MSSPEEKGSGEKRSIGPSASTVQTVIAVTGLFVACVALYAGLTEADAVRKQQQASVWPRLTIATSTGDFDAFTSGEAERFFKIIFINSGIGPARIRAIRVAVDGMPQKNWPSTIEAVTGSSGMEYAQSTISGAVVRPGETYPALALRSDDAALMRENIRRDGSLRIAIDACYCSVFDDCWMATFGPGPFREPEPVKSCADFGEEQFQD